MYLYAGFNELGYLILIEEQVIPLVGATGSGIKRKKKRRLYTKEYTFDLKATCYQTIDKKYPLIASCHIDNYYLYILDAQCFNKYNSEIDLSSCCYLTGEKELKINVNTFITNSSYNLSAISLKTREYSFCFSIDDKKEIECEFGLSIGCTQELSSSLYFCSTPIEIKDISLELKANTNREALLRLLLTEV